jgi:hypothetical protein
MTASQDQQRARSFIQNLFALLIAAVIISVAAYFLLFRERTPDEPPIVSNPFVVTDPMPMLQPIISTNIIFYDSFDDGVIQWDLATLEQARYDGGALVLQDNHYEGIGSARPHLELDDFILEVYTRWLSGAFGGDYGVRFRLNPSGDYYAFYISNDGRYTVGKQIDGDWFEVVSDFSPAIQRGGGVNLLRIEALNDQLRFFVNGQYLVDVTTDLQGVGDLELVAIRPEGTDWLEIAFDNLLVAQHPGRTRTAGTESETVPTGDEATPVP